VSRGAWLSPYCMHISVWKWVHDIGIAEKMEGITYVAWESNYMRFLSLFRRFATKETSSFS
jgi:hypothetical protein